MPASRSRTAGWRRRILERRRATGCSRQARQEIGHLHFGARAIVRDRRVADPVAQGQRRYRREQSCLHFSAGWRQRLASDARGVADRSSGSTRTARRPGSLSSSRSVPPCIWATAVTRLRPSPVPGRERLTSRRTKRFRARSRSAAAMPGPRSATVTVGFAARARGGDGNGWRRRIRMRLRGRILQGIVDEVGERLPNELPIGADRNGRSRCVLQAKARILGRRCVQLGDVGDHVSQVHRLQGFLDRAGFELARSAAAR